VVALKNKLKADVIVLLTVLADYVTLTCKGDRVKLLSSGFPISGASSTQLEQTIGVLDVKLGAPGKATTKVKRLRAARAYMHQYTTELTNAQINDLAIENGYEYRVLKSIIEVESGQHGFDPVTGKIIIQFEPTWFMRLCKDWAIETRHRIWKNNKVGRQKTEWKAFNDAFAINADATMKSTSIGMMQIMGFHYAETGFKTVGDMWDFAKESEYNQVLLTIKWIKTVAPLDLAIKKQDWEKIAYYYNGEYYRAYRYDSKLLAAYNRTDAFINTV